MRNRNILYSFVFVLLVTLLASSCRSKEGESTYELNNEENAHVEIDEVTTYPVEIVTIEPEQEPDENSDFIVIKDRIVDSIKSDTPYYCKQNILDDLVIDENGYYFSSIDYSSQQKANWPVQFHLRMTRDLLIYEGTDILSESEEYRKTIIGLVDYWLDNDFVSENNWWPNQIGIPGYLSDITLLIYDYLDDEQLVKIKAILDRGTFHVSDTSDKYSPANLGDILKNTIKRAVIYGEEDILTHAAECIGDMIVIHDVGEDGLQYDLEYYDYGTVLTIAGSYGAVFTRTITYFFKVLNNTKFSISPDKEGLFVDYILDAQRYFHRNNGTVNFALGRSAVFSTGAEIVYECLSELSKIDNLYRISELRSYFDSWNNNELIGMDCKYFPRSGSLIFLSPDVYFAAHGAQDNNTTLVMSEQGTLNYNLSYGSNTSYMYYGDEYSSIGAVFDFAMFPGTTTYYENDEQLYQRFKEGYNRKWGQLVPNIDGFVHGEVYHEQEYSGIMVSELHNDGITGKNAYIMYNGHFYNLGCNFNCDIQEKDIITTIDQCLSEDYQNDYGLLHKYDCKSNRHFLYRNLCEQPMITEHRIQTGSFKRGDIAGSDDEETSNVFICYYDWGKQLDNISYAYEVCSNENSDNIVVKIINESTCQGIEFENGILVAYAYEDFNYISYNGSIVSIKAGEFYIGKI